MTDFEMLTRIYKYRVELGQTLAEIRASELFSKLSNYDFDKLINKQEHKEIFKERKEIRNSTTTHITFRIGNYLLERMNEYRKNYYSGRDGKKKRSLFINSAIEEKLDRYDEEQKKLLIKNGVKSNE